MSFGPQYPCLWFLVLCSLLLLLLLLLLLVVVVVVVGGCCCCCCCCCCEILNDVSHIHLAIFFWEVTQTPRSIKYLDVPGS